MISELTPLDSLIRDSVLTEISDLSLDISFRIYAKKNHHKLNTLYEKGILDNETLGNALEIAIFKQAKKEVNQVPYRKRYADHFSRPDCLAYTLSRNVLTEEEKESINFDHGDTLETFKKDYSKNLISELTEELINPVEIKFSGDDCCCDCSVCFH